jgi:hypothetical protein
MTPMKKASAIDARMIAVLIFPLIASDAVT